MNLVAEGSLTMWTAFTTFLTNMLTGVGTILSTITGNEVLLTFIVVIPLASIAISMLFKLLGRKKGKRKG